MPWLLLFEKKKEREFRGTVFLRSYKTLRISLLLAIALYAIFGVLDFWITPVSRERIWFIRFALVSPVLLITLLASAFRSFRKLWGILMFTCALVMGAGILAMMATAQKSEPGYIYYYSGLLLVIMWNYSLTRVQFFWACLAGLLIILGFEFVTFYVQGVDPRGAEGITALNNSFFLIASNIIGMFAGYTIEYYQRREFLQNKELSREKSRSDRLLLNILPENIAREMKTQGHVAPREFPSASILFTDFKGFTNLSEVMEPDHLIAELDFCFSYFDSVIEKYHLEKLKTIGDSYMCAGGIPEENHTHPVDCLLAALKIQSFINLIKRRKMKKGRPYWEMRVGINTGKIIAGVIGDKKFAYDIWGDSVNLASIHEASGAPGKINVSHSTAELTRGLFEYESRGPIQAKRKGNIDMYFLKGLRPEYYIMNGPHVAPNEKFHAIYRRIKTGELILGRDI